MSWTDPNIPIPPDPHGSDHARSPSQFVFVIRHVKSRMAPPLNFRDVFLSIPDCPRQTLESNDPSSTQTISPPNLVASLLFFAIRSVLIGPEIDATNPTSCGKAELDSSSTRPLTHDFSIMRSDDESHRGSAIRSEAIQRPRE
jgi:hypothetical protein